MNDCDSFKTLIHQWYFKGFKIKHFISEEFGENKCSFIICDLPATLAPKGDH